ncbi:MAG: universal stress protein [Pikeienuella sp.]|uniref:universal stress protein n=1 Tax=Pikeienuella sp. TaxID=2831957 RepID=UPI00391C4D3F
MNVILAATDLSPRSDRAVARAFRIAAEIGARVSVVCVVDEDLPGTMCAKMAEEAGARLASLSASIPDAGKAAHETRVVTGDPLRDLPRMADEAGADLLVLGVHRPRPLMDMFRATTMEKIVRMSAAPVLVVREPAAAPYATALAGVDLSPSAAVALRAARRIAPGAALHAFHAYSVPFKGFLGEEGAASHPFRDEAASALAEWRAAARLPEDFGEIDLVEGSVASALSAALARLKPDLIAMGAHSRSTLSPTILGSFVTDLLRDPPADLLIARR